MIENGIVTTAEAADILGYTREHVRRLCRAGKLNYTGRVGTAYVFDEDELRDWKAERQTEKLADTE